MEDLPQRSNDSLKRRYKRLKNLIMHSPKGSRSTPASSPNSAKASFSSDFAFAQDDGTITTLEVRKSENLEILEPSPQMDEAKGDITHHIQEPPLEHEKDADGDENGMEEATSPESQQVCQNLELLELAQELEVGEPSDDGSTAHDGNSPWSKLPKLLRNPVVSTWMLVAVVIVIASKVVR